MSNFDIDVVSNAQYDLEEALEAKKNPIDRERLFGKYLATLQRSTKNFIPEFLPDMQWINTSRPLTMAGDLTGKVVVMDFFTYCCVNCLHVIPHIEALEAEFPVESGVVVLGVHSAKFDNERVLENVVSAALRHNLHHPIVNDPAGFFSSTMDVRSWPSLVILSPQGQAVFLLVGEADIQQHLPTFVRSAVTYYREKGEIDDHSLPMRLLTTLPGKSLYYPGKVAHHQHVPDAVSTSGGLAISDSGHHRILITSDNGIVQEIIGGTDPGFVDGNFQECRFRTPQGLAWGSPYVLYVADTENHAIRKINLTKNTVTTVVGTGEQGSDLVGGNVMTKQSLNSPWGLYFWQDENNQNQVLYISMAGSHQVWLYVVGDDVTMPNGVQMARGSCQRIAGSGAEQNFNSPDPLKAGFAQPMGLCVGSVSVAGDEDPWPVRLFVADSESSTIRDIDLATLYVKNLVGATDAIEVQHDIFLHGDIDGVGMDAKLQHAMGVTFCPSRNAVFVADSYNHKIKRVDLASRLCQTYCVGGSSTDPDSPPPFNEPGGLCMKGDDILVVADTNNHQVRLIDLNDGSVTELQIRILDNVVQIAEPEESKSNVKKVVLKSLPDRVETLVAIPLGADRRVTVVLTLTFEAGVKVNTQAPNKWTLYLMRHDESVEKLAMAKLVSEEQSHTVTLSTLDPVPDIAGAKLVLEGTVYICDDKGGCHMKVVRLQAPIGGRQIDVQHQHYITHAIKLE